MTKRTTAAVVVIGVALAVLVSCGLPLTGRPPAPTGVSATTTQSGQITVSWMPVENAGAYLIYRSLSETGPWPGDEAFSDVGDYGAVPYRTVLDTEIVDTDVDPVTYYYRVSALDEFGRSESDLSPVVSGGSSAEELEWGAASFIGFGSSTLEVTADSFGDTARGYVLTVADETPTTPAVRRIGRDGTITVLAEPEASVDGTRRGRVAIAAADGTVYLAALNASTGVPTVWRYRNETDGWSAWATGLERAHGTSAEMNLATASTDNLYLAYRSTDGTLASYRLGTASGESADVSPLSGPAKAVDSNLRLAALADRVYLVFESGGATVYGSVLDGTTWGVATALANDSGGDVDVAGSGLLDAGIDPATGNLYVAYYANDSEAISVLRWTGVAGPTSLVSPPGTTAPPGATEPEAGWPPNVSLTADITGLYLFSVDTDGADPDPAITAVVRRYQFANDAWDLSAFSADNFTVGGAPTTLSIAARNQIVYAGYIDGGVSAVRTYR